MNRVYVLLAEAGFARLGRYGNSEPDIGITFSSAGSAHIRTSRPPARRGPTGEPGVPP